MSRLFHIRVYRQLYDACTMEITALWVYPIKACQGMSVQSAETTATGGFKLDREWCVVDLRGDRYPEREYISQRKLEQMATIAPALSADGASMTVTAPGMEPLVIPVAEEAYEANEAITVKCCGLSTKNRFCHGGRRRDGAGGDYAAAPACGEWSSRT